MPLTALLPPTPAGPHTVQHDSSSRSREPTVASKSFLPGVEQVDRAGGRGRGTTQHRAERTTLVMGVPSPDRASVPTCKQREVPEATHPL